MLSADDDDEHTDPIFFISSVGAVQELEGHVVVLVEPLHHEGLEPGGVLGDLALVGGDVRHVGLVEPLDPEVAVEVGGGLAEAVLLVLLEGVLHVGGKETPDCGGRELGGKGGYCVSVPLCV